MFVKTKTCGALSGESCSVSMVAVLAVVFLSGECCWGPVKNRTLGSVMENPVGSIVVNAVGGMSTVEKAAVVCCRAGHLGTMFILTVCLTLTFFVPNYLQMSQLCRYPQRPGWGKTEVDSSIQCPERLKKLVTHPDLPFPARRTVRSGNVLLVLNSVSVCVCVWGGDVRKNKANLSIIFLWLFSGFLLHSVAAVS